MKFAAMLLFLLPYFSIASGQTSEPRAKGDLTYSLPQSAIDADVSGTVLLRIDIDDTGKAIRAELVGGPMWPCGTMPKEAIGDLRSTITEALMKVSFEPAMKDGKATSGQIGYRLQLKNPKFHKPADVDPSTGKPKPRMITGGIVTGRAKHLVKPAYPPAARASRERGAVTVEVLIDEEGRVIQAGAISGSPGLRMAAREAACASTFSSTSIEGNPVKVSGTLTYNFAP